MGWMAPVRHLGARMAVGETHHRGEPSMDEIETIGLDLATQTAGSWSGSDILHRAAALPGWFGGVRDGALLGAGVAGGRPRGAPDAGAVRQGIRQAEQE